MIGMIQFTKALSLFKKKFGNEYLIRDIYYDFLFSGQLNLFIPIDACICEVTKNGMDDNFLLKGIYPHTGFASLKIDCETLKFLNGDLTFINISEITGLFNSNKNTIKALNASLFQKDIDCNYYASTENMEISELNNIEADKKLNIEIVLNDVFFSRYQLSKFFKKFEEKNTQASDSNIPLRIKEEKSIGLIIAALAELAKIDISVPNSKQHKEKLLPLIDSLDPDGNKMDPKTLAKYLKYAINNADIKTKKIGM